jgi:hypothetical protein
MAPVSAGAPREDTPGSGPLGTALRDLTSSDAAARRTAFAAVEKLGAGPAVESLVMRLAEPGEGDDAAVRVALHGLAVHAARPGSTDRAAFAAAVAARLGAGSAGGPAAGAPAGIRRFLIEALQIAGGEEAVPVLVALLADPTLAEPARAALQANPAPAALEALRKKLSDSGAAAAGGALRLGIIHALGAREDAASGDLLLAVATAGEPSARLAAWEALGRIGEPRAEPVLAAVLAKDDRSERRAAVEGLLRLAERRLAAGKRADAERIYARLAEVPEDHVLCAALRGLGAAGSAGSVGKVAAHLAAGDAAVRRQAAEALATLRGEGVDEAIEKAYREAAGDLKPALDEARARRKGARAF